LFFIAFPFLSGFGLVALSFFPKKQKKIRAAHNFYKSIKKSF